MSIRQARRARFRAGYVVAAALAAVGCGSAGDPPPPDPNTAMCYRCTPTNPFVAGGGGITETGYACTPADAQQFGRRCFR